MSNIHSQSQAKVTTMFKPVFGDIIMTKTLSKSQIISHNNFKVTFSCSILFKSLKMFKTDSKSQI